MIIKGRVGIEYVYICLMNNDSMTYRVHGLRVPRNAVSLAQGDDVRFTATVKAILL